MIGLMIFSLAMGVYVLTAGKKWITFVYEHMELNDARIEITVFCGIVIILFAPIVLGQLLAGLIGTVV